jgi:signal transduction histidine kinase
MTAILAALRLGFVGRPIAAASPGDLLPVLVAIALLCVVGLTRRTHPSTAWLAVIAIAFVVTIDLATYVREVVQARRPSLDDPAWRWLAITVSLSATLAVGSSAAYAFSRPRMKAGRLGVAATLAVLLVITGIAAWAIANPSDVTFVNPASGLGSLGLVTRAFLVMTPLLTAVGIAGDILPSAERARARVALTHRGAASRGDRLAGWARAFADEVSPGRSRARWAVLSERHRFARDIHADVVPGLRRVLADAERGAEPDRLATSLREVLADLEAVGESQHPIQLEIGGLVPALAWLAERLERRADLRITLDVDDPPPGQDGDVPRDVAATTFSVAALALGNVAKHAPASDATVRVRAGRDLVDLAVSDDGPGITDEAIATARANGRRGMADMAAEAATIGATVEIRPGPGGVGTIVAFTWRATGTDR